MGQTMVEKIISTHAGKLAYRNQLVIVDVDAVMASDTTAPLTIKNFEEMGGTKVWDPSKVVLVIDHAAPAPNESIANLHTLMRAFAKQQGITLYDVGDGICHQLMVENGHVKPGQLVLGADSHSCTYGALGAFATGVGSTDLAAVLLTGQTWLKVPETIKIELRGKLKQDVSAKDLILFLVGQLGIDGATYKAVEFSGEAIEAMSLDSRLTMSNMVIEMGAKAGFIDMTGLQLPYEFIEIHADPDAEYEMVYTFDVSELEPQVAIPHSPDLVQPISQVEGKQINQAFIGSCTNGRLEDLHEAANILQGKRIHPDVRLIIAAASKGVFLQALHDGTAQKLTLAGATFLPSGCGPCVGTHLGIAGNQEVIISSTNRNFKGRMGNRESYVYLSSPATVAASALYGKITNPQHVAKEVTT